MNTDEQMNSERIIRDQSSGELTEMIYPITKYGAPVLESPAKPVEMFDDELAKLCEDMFESMYVAQGVGLAATQIGISQEARRRRRQRGEKSRSEAGARKSRNHSRRRATSAKKKDAFRCRDSAARAASGVCDDPRAERQRAKPMRCAAKACSRAPSAMRSTT